jgi:exopolyphosphatase/guanosine-5'-triphosphate,3'-diphosphate pyrophosphatase
MTLDPMTPAPATTATATSTTTTLHLALGDAVLRATVTGGGSAGDPPASLDLPVGLDVLRRTIAGGDPPAPIDLTNAIGLVTDHLDDLVRELPSTLAVEQVVLDAPVARAIAAVEVGGPPPLPFALDREAAEDVFRTVATEPLADRRLNPGLPADQVQDVVAGACAVVALMRHLQLQTVLIAGEQP